MFSIEQLEAKIKELATQIEQSAANHHMLLGSKMTFESLIAQAKGGAEVVAAVDPALAPVVGEVEGIATAVEGVVEAI